MEALRRQEAARILAALSAGHNDEALEAAEPYDFTLSVAGIHCHYSPEILGPYGQGESEVLVPYRAIRSVLRRGGPAVQFGFRAETTNTVIELHNR